MSLSDSQVLTITQAGVLLARQAAALSDFEVELIAEVGERFLRHGREAVVTAAEWQVVEDAVAAMRAAMPRLQVRRVAA